MPLLDLPADARPREKLLARGAAVLADSELLALVLRTGMPGANVLQWAERLLNHFGGLAGLLRASDAQLKAVKGLGPAKRAELAAVLEIARRVLAQQLAQAPVFDSPQNVKDYVALQMGGLQHEEFLVLFLDARHRLLATRTLFRGTLDRADVHPREVVREVLALGAGAVVIAHNHPSGVAEPSKADEYLTHQLKSALQLFEVKVLDHLIVGCGQVVSMAERGRL